MVKTLCAILTGAVLSAAPAMAQQQGLDGAVGGGGPVGDGIWARLDILPPQPRAAMPRVLPASYSAWSLDPLVLLNIAAAAPLEGTPAAQLGDNVVLSLPMPDGSLRLFRVIESPNMEPALAAQYPMIRSFQADSIDAPGLRGRIDFGPLGFNAMIGTPDGDVFIQPLWQADQFSYMSYFSKDRRGETPGACGVVEQAKADIDQQLPDLLRTGPNRRNYRLALAATGEYTAANGGTVTTGLAALNTLVNSLNVIFEREITVRMTLVANNNLIVFTDAATDPFTGNSTTAMITQAQQQIPTRIGSSNFDIGHVVSGLNIGGIASLGVVCQTNSKARGVSGQIIGDNAYNAFICAHEMGHQMNAPHTFNSSTGGCNGNRSADGAYEPGGGYTIMSYTNGLCGVDDLGLGSSFTFHSGSFDRIRSYVGSGGGSCNTATSTGNTAPLINAGIDYTIPDNTPFELTPASFSDTEGNPLSFSWEQRDLDNQGVGTSLAAGDTGINPIIRTLPFATASTRTIPTLSNLVNNTFARGEILPTTNRNLNFRVTARDGLGGVNTDDMRITVIDVPSPFSLTNFNSAASILPGNQTITWNVAGTDAAPFNVANVRIRLSTDGGFTYPTTLAASVPNNGSAVVVIPAIETATARLRVEAIGNIFFDINNANLTVIPNPTCPSVATQPAFVSTSFADTVTYTVSATGTGPLNFQWRRNGTNLNNAGRVSGVNTSSLRITSITTSDLGSYDVVISNICGSVTSSSAGLAIFCNGAWSASTVPALDARDGAALSYDPDRGLSVLFGGLTPNPSADTLEWDGAAWTTRNPADSPTPRAFAAMAYDPSRDVTVLFGGQNADGSVTLGDTWEYDGTTWSQRTIAGSNPPAGAFSMVYDSARARIILWVDNVLWEYDGSSWALRAGSAITGSVVRRRPALGYDTARSLIVLYGGRDAGNNVVGSLYEWNNVFWSFRSTAVNPGSVADAASAYDPARRRFNLFGGTGTSGPLNASWTWDGTTWRSVATVPPTRARGASAFDVRRNETVLVGGTGDAARTDTWRFGNTISFAQMPAAASITPGSTFSTAALLNGVPTTLRWRLNGFNVNNGAAGAAIGGGTVSGATTASLAIADAQLPDAGDYSLLITNICGTLESQPANLAVNPLSCFVDFNADGFLNQEDLAGYIGTFLDESIPTGPSGTNTAPCPGEPAPYDILGYAADFNRDCSFNQEDLAGFITEYLLQTEDPSGCIPG